MVNNVFGLAKAQKYASAFLFILLVIIFANGCKKAPTMALSQQGIFRAQFIPKPASVGFTYLTDPVNDSSAQVWGSDKIRKADPNL